MGWARAPASLLALVEAEPDADEVGEPVLELEPPDVVEEPELLPLVEELLPLVEELLEVPFELVPLDIVSFVLVPLPVVLLVTGAGDVMPVDGEATATRVELTAAGAAGGV